MRKVVRKVIRWNRLEDTGTILCMYLTEGGKRVLSTIYDYDQEGQPLEGSLFETKYHLYEFDLQDYLVPLQRRDFPEIYGNP